MTLQLILFLAYLNMMYPRTAQPIRYSADFYLDRLDEHLDANSHPLAE